MRARPGWKLVETTLPMDSEVYRDLKSFAEEMGDIDTATAIRLILITWSKARRGQLGQLWGFSFFGPAMMPSMVQTSPAEPTQENGHTQERRKRHSVARSAVDALDLDL